MPVPDTKYNFNYDISMTLPTNYQQDISKASFTHGNHIITCDISDTLTNDNEPYKIYLDSKAAFLMHPFSQARNCTTKFNNEKQAFQYQKPARPIFNENDCQDISSIHTQKIIQNQVRVPSSLYTMHLAALYTNNQDLSQNTLKGQYNASDRSTPHGLKTEQSKATSIKPNYGVDVKHNSYDRYLARKKSQNLKTQPISRAAIKPLFGNKTRTFGLTRCEKTC